MATTFVKIATVTVGSGGTSSIDFSSIPATYTDLCILASLRDSISGGNWTGVKVQLDGSSSSYSVIYLYGSGSGTGSGPDSASSYIGGWQNSNSNTANTFGSGSIYIPNYAGSNYKSISTDSVSESNATDALQSLVSGLWSNTSAITSIAITCNSGGNWMQYSTATLYGIKNS